MEIIQATIGDLDGVTALLKKYHINSISQDDKTDGFVTTNMTPAQMEALTVKERGIIIAKRDTAVVGFAMAASWRFWSTWPLFAHMIKMLPNYSFMGQTLSAENSYQYGPICVDRSVRGTGTFEKLFYASLESMSHRYSIMVTFINQINYRSHAAHTRKVPMEVLGTFTFNDNTYYMLACPTRQ